MSNILQFEETWFWHRKNNNNLAVRVVKRTDIDQSEAYFGAVTCSFLLARAGFGQFVRTDACIGGGGRQFLFVKRSVPYERWQNSGLPAGAVALLHDWSDDSLRKYCASTHAELPPVMAPQIHWGVLPEAGAGEALLAALGPLPS